MPINVPGDAVIPAHAVFRSVVILRIPFTHSWLHGFPPVKSFGVHPSTGVLYAFVHAIGNPDTCWNCVRVTVCAHIWVDRRDAMSIRVDILGNFIFYLEDLKISGWVERATGPKPRIE